MGVSLKLRRVLGYGLVLSVLVLPLASGCAKRPSKEELTRLEEACKAADSAEQTLADKKQELSKLKSELSSRKSELRRLEAKRDAVKANLSKKGM
jgi:septal ring factor EnvC (AmiA/AmiB activator)